MTPHGTVAEAWIIIPVHNRRELTLGCLRHLSDIGAMAKHQIAIVDDGSTDGTSAAVRADFREVRIISGDGSLWWTGAIARGMSVAHEAGASAVVWLNDDCLPEADTLETILHRATAGPPAIVTPICVQAESDQPVEVAFAGRTPHALPPAGASELRADGLSGFCVAIPRAVWTTIGFPDARRFPHYYGDNAYTLAAARAGFPNVLTTGGRARLARYRERAHSVGEYRARIAGQGNARTAVFQSNRSPFRLRTQWHYLRLRYGMIPGAALWLLRAARWQWEFIASARAADSTSAMGR